MSPLSVPELERRALDLKWILCDVDGVLTDGGLYYGHRHQSMRFDVKDGQGLKLAQRAGLKVGILSGRDSMALQRRAAELGLDTVIAGRPEKGPAFDEFLADKGVSPRQVVFIGDDLPDLVVMARCGLSFCPADAVEEVRRVADIILERGGGRGAAREMVETLLRARGEWERTLSPFTFEG